MVLSPSYCAYGVSTCFPGRGTETETVMQAEGTTSAVLGPGFRVLTQTEVYELLRHIT